MKMKRLIILDGPSCAGKSTLISLLIDAIGGSLCVSHTTRAPRPIESESDYHFVSMDEFDDMVQRDDFIEHVTMHGNKYGMSKSEFIAKLKDNEYVYHDSDYHGIVKMLEWIDQEDILNVNEILVLFIDCDQSEIERRMVIRDGTKSQIRLNNAHEERLLYDYNKELFNGYFDTTNMSPEELLREVLKLI